jgi:hypothetical protein
MGHPRHPPPPHPLRMLWSRGGSPDSSPDETARVIFAELASQLRMTPDELLVDGKRTDGRPARHLVPPMTIDTVNARANRGRSGAKIVVERLRSGRHAWPDPSAPSTRAVRQVGGAVVDPARACGIDHRPARAVSVTSGDVFVAGVHLKGG